MATDKTQFQTPGERKRALDLSRQPTKPPTSVKGYDPQRFLGSGAFGEVWVALDRNTGRQVAIKFFAHRSSVNWSSLSREVEKLVFLSADRYVVQLLDVGWNADPPYYVMEYIENGSLDDYLREQGSLPVAEAVTLFREIAIGLSHAHGKGILHCDLKPANVLLDQDHMPRLADFGQSRMTSEQHPALGTLFYMAPEQAGMDAVPDARWDVYALGSVLYCMLTGTPPHRSAEAIDAIDSVSGLPERLQRYREYIASQPPAMLHRRIRGVDRRLAEIVDKCIAPDPKNRFPHVQSVLLALRERDESQLRVPLQLLGIAGPLLLLLIMAVFGFRGYERAIQRSQKLAIETTLQVNRFAAEGEARNVANELEERFLAISDVSSRPELPQLVEATTSDAAIVEYLALIGDVNADDSLVQGARSELMESAALEPLANYVRTLMIDRRLPPVASWLITDQQGTMLAAAFSDPPSTSPVGDNFAYRSYFHGRERDDQVRRANTPLGRPRLSAPFTSTATNTYKVAISAPIRSATETVGVLAMTFELGQFVRFPQSRDQCAVLIDGRSNDFQGLILQHPLYESLQKTHRRIPFDISDPAYRVDVERLLDKAHPEHTDPLGRSSYGEDYRGPWITWAASVAFDAFDPDGNPADYGDTRLLLLVERRKSTTVEPVTQLAHTLFREGATALAVVVIVSIALWYFVLRMLGNAKVTSVRSYLDGDSSQSVHSRETLEMPTIRSH